MKIRLYPMFDPQQSKKVHIDRDIDKDDGVIIERAGNDIINSIQTFLTCVECNKSQNRSHVQIRIRKSARAYAFYVTSIYSSKDSSTTHKMTSALENIIKEFMNILSKQTGESLP